MDKKTKGAGLLHHSRKIQATTNQDFDAIGFAGKCGTLLSAISAERQAQITQQRLDALARANNISPRTEAPPILAELQRQKIILSGSGGIEVLGLSHDESPHRQHPHRQLGKTLRRGAKGSRGGK